MKRLILMIKAMFSRKRFVSATGHLYILSGGKWRKAAKITEIKYTP